MLGIRPWEWALLTVEDANAVLDWLEGYEDAVERRAAEWERG